MMIGVLLAVLWFVGGLFHYPVVFLLRFTGNLDGVPYNIMRAAAGYLVFVAVGAGVAWWYLGPCTGMVVAAACVLGALLLVQLHDLYD